MPDVKENRLPVFSWENLATTNIELAKKFYQGLFGWDVTDIPTGTYGTHSFFSLHGKEVCSVSEIKEKQRKSFASQWVPYISIENIEELIGRIQNAGGAVLDAISPIADAGQTTIIKDPTNAIFAVWHPSKNARLHRNEVPGMPCFHELMTTNLDMAGMFYVKIFNWRPRAENFGDITYIMFNAENLNVGSMMGVPNQNFQPRWITYWCVQDCDRSLRKALSLGGKISKTVEIIKRKGRYAILADPLGAIFGIMEPVN